MHVNIIAPAHLTLSCYKCTAIASFEAQSSDVALRDARSIGWLVDGGGCICPKCPAYRRVAA